MNKNGLILTLESSSTTQDYVKNENIELIPRVPVQLKISVKERVAPLRLRFEFFDTQKRLKIKNPDVLLCLSPTAQCPTVETSLITKTDWKDPKVSVFRELQGKVIPEYNPLSKKEKFPQ